MLWMIRRDGVGRVVWERQVDNNNNSPPDSLPTPSFNPLSKHLSQGSLTLVSDRSSSQGFPPWKYLVEKAGNSVAWFVDIWKFIGICLNRSEVVQMRGKNQKAILWKKKCFEFIVLEFFPFHCVFYSFPERWLGAFPHCRWGTDGQICQCDG